MTYCVSEIQKKNLMLTFFHNFFNDIAALFINLFIHYNMIESPTSLSNLFFSFFTFFCIVQRWISLGIATHLWVTPEVISTGRYVKSRSRKLLVT